jgi:release factor glutamine methyltransferase
VAGPTRLDQALHSATLILSEITETPKLDAQILLSHVLDRERSWLLAHPEYQLDEARVHVFNNLVARVRQGEALPYITGERWFYGRRFTVSPAVLIPRPETELLVEMGLDYLRNHPGRRYAVDVGTGSGCIAVTLCGEVPDLKMLAVDRSFEAVQIAHANAFKHGVGEQIDFIVSDLLSGITTEFDLICANLPYIPVKRLASLEVARREPVLALDGGPEGLIYIVQLIRAAESYLTPGGCLILEIDETQGKALVQLVSEMYPAWSVALQHDLAGLDRVMELVREE